MVGIGIIAESCFKVPYLKLSKKNTFVTGEKYKLSAKIRNLHGRDFPGGNFRIVIQWPNGLQVNWAFQVNAMRPNEIFEQEYGITDVLDDGPALFLAEGTDTNGQKISFCDMHGNRLTPQKQGLTHVYTIIPKNAEELYQLWALLIGVVALLPIFIKDIIIPLIQWLISTVN